MPLKKISPLLLLLLAGCAVGPDYVRPEQPLPTAYKELRNADGSQWKTAEPRDHLPRGKWWTAFGDPLLNQLEEDIASANLNLQVAEAQYRQAEALARGARAAWLPTVSGTVTETRNRTVSSTSTSNSANSSGVPVTTANGIRTNRNLSFNASWEADVWGRIERSVEAGDASLAASAADLENVRLSLQATLAQNYLLLRITDEQQRLYDATVAAYRQSLEMVKNQKAAGVVSQAEVMQATTQLKTAEAQGIDLGVQRAQLEHAIALLLGKAPADFSIPVAATPANVALKLPNIPVGLPSELLERRPDIAAAERRAAAANAQIGVAKAAFFPALTLSASTGFQSSSLANWFTLPNRVWAIGPSLAATLFDGGKRSAATDQASAGFDASAATYRQTILGGLQEVEDNLASLRILEEEAKVLEEAVEAARQSVKLTTLQYQAGTVSYLNVITVQTTALNNERTAATLFGRQLTASVGLVKALGGGWQ
jgi:NodT family efflux transporter outer membrane factor (OMF) lipoprotein